MPFNILAAVVGLIIALTTSQLTDVGALAPPGSNCTRICGGVNIPYPFGLEPECAMPGFNLTCEETTDGSCSGIGCCQTAIPRGLYHYNRWFDQRFSTAEIHDSYAALVEADWDIGKVTYSAAPFVVDWDIGKVTYDVAQQNPDYACVSSNSECVNSPSVPGYYIYNCSEGFQGNPYLHDPEHGWRGCCQTAIPRGLDHYNRWFEPRWYTAEIHDAALIEGLEASNITFLNLRGTYLSAPFVVDWDNGKVTCDVAQLKLDYACVSSNSEGVNSPSVPGYICNCSQGFQGNPYLQDPEHGCKDFSWWWTIL